MGRGSGSVGLIPAGVASSSGFGTTASSGDMTFEPLGVEVADEGPPSITDAGISSGVLENGRAGGRGVASETS